MKLSNIIKVTVAASLSLFILAAFTACGSEDASKDNVIRVGASPSPHAEILKAAESELEKEGYALEIKEFSDYVQPNVALSAGEIDANYFQHLPYLEDYNKEKGTDLVSAGNIHFEPLTIFAGKSNDLKNVPENAKIAVPSDTTNEARALLLLEDQGLLKLKEGVGLTATKNDIVENPKNIDIVEAEAASLPRTLDDVDFAVINGNFALAAGLDKEKALVGESVDSDAFKKYGNIIAVQSENKDSAKTQALIKALQSDEVRDFIKTKYGEEVIPEF